MPFLDLEAFTAIGGPPSNKWGSNYSSVCKLLKEVDDLRNHRCNYNPKAYQDKVFALDALLQRFHPNDTGGTNVKKNNEIAAARRLRDSFQEEVDFAKISQLLDKMTKNGMALIANTGREVIRKVSAGTFGISFTTDAAVNASFQARTLQINKTNFWQSEKLAMGILIHEYHHSLSRSIGPNLYLDEFVAHWKQYTAMGLGDDKFDNLNNWLLDDARGYKLRNTEHFRGKSELASPEQAGTIWSSFINNMPS